MAGRRQQKLTLTCCECGFTNHAGTIIEMRDDVRIGIICGACGVGITALYGRMSGRTEKAARKAFDVIMDAPELGT